MPRIRSSFENFESSGATRQSTGVPDYRHPIDRAETDREGLHRRKSGVPMAFQVTSPFDYRRVLLPHALVMHVNPSTLDETLTKKVERIQTRGGFVEQHWGDELSDLSIQASTGSFMNIRTGLTSLLRERTIAYDRYLDLKDLYENNGSVYDPYGNVVLQGKIMLMYDRGTYIGHFRTFSVEETDESPFAFQMNLTFKVEKTLLQVPINQLARQPRPPQFQARNTEEARWTSNAQGNLLGQVDNSIQRRQKADQMQATANQDLDLAGQPKEEWLRHFEQEAANSARREADAAFDNIGSDPPGLPTRGQ